MVSEIPSEGFSDPPPREDETASAFPEEAAPVEEVFILAAAPPEVSEHSPPASGDAPVRMTEASPPESGAPLASERKRPPAPQKSAKSIGRSAGNEHAAGDSLLKNVPDKSLAETPSGVFSAPPGISPASPRNPEASGLPREPEVSLAAAAAGSEAPPPVLPESPLLGAGSSGPDVPAHIFPSLLNDRVKDFISFFQGRAESFFSRSLARSQAYEQMMKRIFREKNLPEDLFYLALIESGYNPTALSRAKASGIWQFISQTAKRFGLRVDKWVDERRDPEKSTLAAAEYLKTLHEMFHCWDLATAGYNAGEGKVLGAMKKVKSEDFWELSKSRYLKKETKEYVPMFLAAMTIAKEPQKYGFANIDYHPPLLYEKVAVPPATSLALVAKAAETDLAEIRALNPALLREKTPPNLPRFEVNLPPGKKEVFEKNFSSLSRAAASKNTHRVSPGDTLSRLAKKYNVTVQELCQANALTAQATLKLGSFLKIPD